MLHKEQMMTVPTVVLYIIINFFFFFKATTCATCPYFVLGIVHQKEKGTCVL